MPCCTDLPIWTYYYRLVCGSFRIVRVPMVVVIVELFGVPHNKISNSHTIKIGLSCHVQSKHGALIFLYTTLPQINHRCSREK